MPRESRIQSPRRRDFTVGVINTALLAGSLGMAQALVRHRAPRSREGAPWIAAGFDGLLISLPSNWQLLPPTDGWGIGLPTRASWADERFLGNGKALRQIRIGAYSMPKGSFKLEQVATEMARALDLPGPMERPTTGKPEGPATAINGNWWRFTSGIQTIDDRPVYAEFGLLLATSDTSRLRCIGLLDATGQSDPNRRLNDELTIIRILQSARPADAPSLN